MKKTRNKFFSISLMWEGIKQTKTIGICFTIISIIAACLLPAKKMISLYSMDSVSFNSVTVETVSLIEFLLPIFIVMYIVPIVFVLSLFRFMNRRDASDFYHSTPHNRSCVYITYSAVVLIWSIFIISLSTLSSLILYSFIPKTAAIPYDFAVYTILSSFVLAMLVMSITLVAKGLSGTGFSNAVITFLLMFAPRIIIMFFAQSIINATVIVDASMLSIANPSCNIIFSPLIIYTNYSAEVLTSSLTIGYSVILAVIYFALGMFLHKKRNSETAGASSSFKFVQHIVRTSFGVIPTLFICFALASGDNLNVGNWLACILVSLLLYFLYELATTRSAKKLLRAAPLYLVVVAFNIVFVLGSHMVSNSIMNDIPESSDIESVSVYDSGEALNMENSMVKNYKFKSYYSLMADEAKINDKDLIKVLQESLIDNINAVKSNAKSFNGYIEYTSYEENDNIISSYPAHEEYKVTFHMNSGRDIVRKVYVDKQKYLTKNQVGSGESVLFQYLNKNSEYMDVVTALPKENEIASVNLLYSDLTEEQTKELWNTFRDEYNGLSYKDRACVMNDSYGQADVGTFDIKGYYQNKQFTTYCTILSKSTPKTFSKYLNIINEDFRKNFTSEIMDNITADKDFSIHSDDEFKQDTVSNNDYFYRMYIDYVASSEYEDDMMGSSIDACFPSLKTSYIGSFNSKNLKDIRKIAQIINDALSNEFDINGAHPIRFNVNILERTITKHEGGVSMSSKPSSSKTAYVNLTDEQYKQISDILGGIVDNTYSEHDNVNEGDTELIPITE